MHLKIPTHGCPVPRVWSFTEPLPWPQAGLPLLLIMNTDNMMKVAVLKGLTVSATVPILAMACQAVYFNDHFLICLIDCLFTAWKTNVELLDESHSYCDKHYITAITTICVISVVTATYCSLKWPSVWKIYWQEDTYLFDKIQRAISLSLHLTTDAVSLSHYFHGSV